MPRNRQVLARCALVAALGGGAACIATHDEAPAGAPARPNIVVLFLDDAGYGDFGYNGNPLIRTPNIDRMAADGLRFTQFYSASPACTASRYSLLTGRLPVRSGFAWVLTPDSPRGLHADEWTLAEALRQAGYATALFGKWHLGVGERFLPLQHGFDEYFGIPYSNDMQPPRWGPLPLLEGNATIAHDPDQTLLTAEFTRRAVDFARRHRDQPFFLYLSYTMPHLPLMPGADFAGGSPRGTYGDVIEEIDWSVGEVLDALRQTGADETTLVLFTSDNGPWIIKNEEGGSSGPFRDGKGSTWEGGMRVPGIAWWPGSIAAGGVDRQVAGTLDILPTALALAGVEPPADRRIDGHDLTPRLLAAPGDADPATEIQRRPLFYYGPGHHLHAVRDGRWKLHVRTSSQTGVDYFNGELPLLFDLEADPGERWNRAATEPRIVARLRALIDAHQAEVAGSGTFFDR